MSSRYLSWVLLLASLPAIAAENPDVLRLDQRLMALQANPQSNGVAAYEKLQAQQAVAALGKARSRDRELLLYLAERRVEIAETMVRAELSRREAAGLERTRSDLLLEASRRQTARAMQEAERLRIQAQIQAEEAEQLRQAAETELLARQDAENTLNAVAGQQSAKLNAARQKEARLAREEAELVSGATLPVSRFEARGEVFTLPGSSFAAGQAKPTASAAESTKALGQYLQIGRKGRVRIEAYDTDPKLAQQRAEALRDALVANGVSASRIQTTGKAGAAGKTRAAEVVVAP